MSWAQLPCDRILAALQGDAMFDKYHHAALNRSLDNQTLLACALRNYITAVQIGDPARILAAEEEAVEALQSVGGDGVTEPAVAEI